jgi:integrase
MRNRANLKLVTDNLPTALLGSTPRQPRTKHRKFLTEAEVEALARAADSHRDKTMIMVAFRHGLRVSELVGLRWEQVDLDVGTMRIYRTKHGRDATHPMPGSEVRALRRLKREGHGEFVFLSRLHGPMTRRAFAQLLQRAAAAAGLPHANPHALRHATGYKLAGENRSLRDIQHYIGHRQIASTEIYTEAAPTNFRGFFK